MEASKQRPNVLITTYTSSYIDSEESDGLIGERARRRHFGALNQQHGSSSNDFCPQDAAKQVSNSEKSTNLFMDMKRRLQRGRFEPHKMLLSDASDKILLSLSQIRGPTGSVRGHRDVVRKSLENIKVVEFIGQRRRRDFGSASMPSFVAPEQQQQQHQDTSQESIVSTNATDRFRLVDSELERKEYLGRLREEERNLCVAYTTSLGVIRRTFEDSKLMKSILNLNLIRYEERDIYLNQEYREQLRARCLSIEVPLLFVHGQQVGGVNELESLNENGELAILMAGFKMANFSNELCKCCGNARFIACQSCNGSRKSAIHHFKFNSIALRCTKCDKNEGIVQCPLCQGRPAPEGGGSPTGSDPREALKEKEEEAVV